MKLPPWVARNKLLSVGIALLSIHLTIYTVQKTALATKSTKRLRGMDMEQTERK